MVRILSKYHNRIIFCCCMVNLFTLFELCLQRFYVDITQHTSPIQLLYASVAEASYGVQDFTSYRFVVLCVRETLCDVYVMRQASYYVGLLDDLSQFQFNPCLPSSVLRNELKLTLGFDSSK